MTRGKADLTTRLERADRRLNTSFQSFFVALVTIGLWKFGNAWVAWIYMAAWGVQSLALWLYRLGLQRGMAE